MKRKELTALLAQDEGMFLGRLVSELERLRGLRQTRESVEIVTRLIRFVQERQES